MNFKKKWNLNAVLITLKLFPLSGNDKIHELIILYKGKWKPPRVAEVFLDLEGATFEAEDRFVVLQSIFCWSRKCCDCLSLGNKGVNPSWRGQLCLGKRSDFCWLTVREGEITVPFWLAFDGSFFTYFVALPEYSTLGKHKLFSAVSRGLNGVTEKARRLSTALQNYSESWV